MSEKKRVDSNSGVYRLNPRKVATAVSVSLLTALLSFGSRAVFLISPAAPRRMLSPANPYRV